VRAVLADRTIAAPETSDRAAEQAPRSLAR
jgi:hypothetical protein